MTENKSVMAYNIQRFMKEKGVRSIDVANAIGVPKSTFSSWTTGSMYPRIDKIEKLAKFFGCTKADLVEDPSSVIHQYEMTTDEYKLICLYRDADEETKSMIKRLLNYIERRE